MNAQLEIQLAERMRTVRQMLEGDDPQKRCAALDGRLVQLDDYAQLLCQAAQDGNGCQATRLLRAII